MGCLDLGQASLSAVPAAMCPCAISTLSLIKTRLGSDVFRLHVVLPGNFHMHKAIVYILCLDARGKQPKSPKGLLNFWMSIFSSNRNTVTAFVYTEPP